jgi:hypothetical protein
MSTSICANENRRDAVRTLEDPGAILSEWDGLPGGTSDEKTLEVHFIHPPGKPNAVSSLAPALGEQFRDPRWSAVQNIAIEKGSLSFR